jgi:hypothetical protein
MIVRVFPRIPVFRRRELPTTSLWLGVVSLALHISWVTVVWLNLLCERPAACGL